ncbi:hypothetical protein PCANC_27666 [Puccinia coronata f. sp. avenae]|uniref:DDE Tnp4 domain-containing protein n=1 Tax=Puccinia coronata f. sp. avenae TaxID=200324 RepID=A0A2N5S0I1_9BASI|nr:hypothetical protein PCANC_27666 [Puccinia coronata f. sp. avenae]
MAAYTLQQLFSITAVVCLQDLLHARQCLLTVLKDLRITRIMWPSSESKCQRFSNMIKQKFPLLTGCFGFTDGLNLPVFVDDNEELQNAFYNGWTCSHYCSNILTFAPNGTIIHAIINAPGLWHDSNIEERLYQKLMTDTPLGIFQLS